MIAHLGDDGFVAAPPTIFLTDSDVAEVADWPSAIEALRVAYSRPDDDRATPTRAVAATATGWQRVMPSAPPGAKFAGSKTITVNLRDRLASYLITLFDQHDSRLVALIDGNRITGIRTAATAAVAVQRLVTTSAVAVAVIGSGFEAREQLRAVARVTEVAEARVFSPTLANREAFAAELSVELGFPVLAVSTAQAAAEGAALILCAARSRDESPTVLSDWVEEDATVVSVGSTTPGQRELDTTLIGRASLIVADALDEVLHDSGDLIAARADGFEPDRVTISLSALLKSAEPRPPGIAIYKSTGSGFQDIVLAELLHDRAVERGIGTQLPVGILTIRK